MSAAALAALDAGGMARAEARARRRSALAGLGFVAPALFMVGAFLLYPVAYNVWISLTKWKRFAGLDEWGGLSQYARLLRSPNFAEAMTNTVIWVGVSLVVPVLLGLAIAILVRGRPGEELAKSIFFLPRVLAPTAVGVLWFYVYAPDGVLNAVLGGVSGSEVDIGWLYDDATVTPAVILAYLWQTAGLAMVLLLLGLAAVPRDPLEAAAVEGASAWQSFRHITLPLLAPTLLVVIILSVLAGFTVFDHIWVMAKDYPGKRTLSLTVYMYVEAFEKSSWAYASAIAIVLGAVVLVVTLVQVVLQERVERMTR